MGEKGEGSGGYGGGNWGKRGRELGMWYPLSTPSLTDSDQHSFRYSYVISVFRHFLDKIN